MIALRQRLARIAPRAWALWGRLRGTWNRSRSWNRSRKGLIRDVLLISGATALSRLFGLVRDALIADRFGASAAYDAYLIAFFIPFMLRRLLAEGALSTAFVPLYTGYLHRDREAADEFASAVFSHLLLFFPVLIGLGVWLVPYYIPFLADGFSLEKQRLTVLLARVLFPFIGLVGPAAVVMGLLHGQRHFFAPAFAPVVFNLGVITGAWGLARLTQPPVLGLALGALLGGLGMLLLQLPYLRGRLRFRFTLAHPGLRRLAWMVLPAVLGLAGEQINLLVDNKLASHLGDGAISSLQYAIRLFQLPLGLFAVAISNALLPRLAAAVQRGPGRLAARLRQGLGLTWTILLPATVGLYVLGEAVIKLLFEHGRFTAQDTAATFYALSFYLPGMIAYGGVYILTKAFYALYDTRTPVLIGLAAMGVNVGLDYALVGPLGTGGLALATSAAGWVNLLLLGTLIGRRLKSKVCAPLARQLANVSLAAGVMGGLTFSFLRWLTKLSVNEFLVVILPTLLGVVVFFALIKLLKALGFKVAGEEVGGPSTA